MRARVGGGRGATAAAVTGCGRALDVALTGGRGWGGGGHVDPYLLGGDRVDAVDGAVVVTVGVCRVDSTQLDGHSVGAGGVTAMSAWQRQLGMVAHIGEKTSSGREEVNQDARNGVVRNTCTVTQRRPARARLAKGGRCSACGRERRRSKISRTRARRARAGGWPSGGANALCTVPRGVEQRQRAGSMGCSPPQATARGEWLVAGTTAAAPSCGEPAGNGMWGAPPRATRDSRGGGDLRGTRHDPATGGGATARPLKKSPARSCSARYSPTCGTRPWAPPQRPGVQ